MDCALPQNSWLHAAAASMEAFQESLPPGVAVSREALCGVQPVPVRLEWGVWQLAILSAL